MISFGALDSNVTLRFHPEALEELCKSIDFYFARSPQAARRFVRAVDAALNSIQHDPDRFAHVGRQERGRRITKFPFQVIYRVSSDVIYVVAVAHTSRRPAYWKGRHSGRDPDF